MARPILNITHCNFLKKTEALIPHPQLSPLHSFITQNNLEHRLSVALYDNPALRLATFVDSQGFRDWFQKKVLHKHPSQYGVFLGSKVLSCLLPKGAVLSVFHESLLKNAVEATNVRNVILNNPFKTVEALQTAAALGVRNMVVNTPDEIEKLDATNKELSFLWEFDQIDVEASEVILTLLSQQNLFLKGLKFKDIPLTLLPQVQNLIHLGTQLGHHLKLNTFGLELHHLSSFLKKRKNTKLLPEITDIDTSKFIVCGAKVIGKNKYNRVYSEKVEEIMAPKAESVNLSLSSGEWTFFHPSRCFNLEEISDQMMGLEGQGSQS